MADGSCTPHLATGNASDKDPEKQGLAVLFFYLFGHQVSSKTIAITKMNALVLRTGRPSSKTRTICQAISQFYALVFSKMVTRSKIDIFAI